MMVTFTDIRFVFALGVVAGFSLGTCLALFFVIRALDKKEAALRAKLKALDRGEDAG